MQVRTDRNWLAPGFWLALAVIFLHALTPSATPWRVSDGSAFNGFTRDVSLGPSRAMPPEKEQRVRERRFDLAATPVAGPVAVLLPSAASAFAAPVRPDEAFTAPADPDLPLAPNRRQRARDPPIV